MTPSALQVPPRFEGASQSTCGAASERSVLFSFPFAKNASERPSGDQNGYDAPSVPGTRRGATVSTARRKRELTPSAVRATNARRLPSGDRARAPVSSGDGMKELSGAETANRVTRTSAGPLREEPSRNATMP